MDFSFSNNYLVVAEKEGDIKIIRLAQAKEEPID